MFDIKDVPAATGYTLVTWAWSSCSSVNVRRAAASVLGSDRRPVRGRPRPGLWPGLAASLGIIGLPALGARARCAGGRVTPLTEMALGQSWRTWSSGSLTWRTT